MSVFKRVMLGLGIVLSFIGCLQADVLYANGSVKVYEKRIISSYEIGLGTVPSSPAVGVTHFATYVKDMDTGYLLKDVDVIFTATDNELGKQISPKPMTSSLMDPNYYELDINFETEELDDSRIVTLSGSVSFIENTVAANTPTDLMELQMGIIWK